MACNTRKPLTQERRYKLLGYINILEKSSPNGSCIHDLKQEITVLRLTLGMNLDITDSYEDRVKNTIRRLYPPKDF